MKLPFKNKGKIKPSSEKIGELTIKDILKDVLQVEEV